MVAGLSAERAAKEAQIRDDMIRVAHRAGASLGQLAEVSGLDRKTVTAIVGAALRMRQSSNLRTVSPRDQQRRQRAAADS